MLVRTEIMFVPYACTVLLTAGLASPQPTSQRSNGTAHVDLTQLRGPATQLASGWIYGFPDNSTSASSAIPDHFITDVKFHSSRAGCAQTPSPGWASGGLEGYIPRFESTLSNYRTTRKYGGEFVLLPHDLWGSDGIQGEDALYPGDDGDWSEMEAFLDRVTTDIKANDMTGGLIIDIWNEPNLWLFWNRTWPQYLDLWERSFNIYREGLPDVRISGPAAAGVPNSTDSDWIEWCALIAETNTIPDIYSWHSIGDEKLPPDSAIKEWEILREQSGIPDNPIDVNEYAWPEQQNQAGSAWYFGQLERHNHRGQRANGASKGDLHSFLGGLLGKDTGGKYFPNGDWQALKYYAAMDGERVTTIAAEDLLFDVFTVEGDVLKIIAGTRTLRVCMRSR